MHRDDLAGLGEALRRELQDLVGGGPAALADLEADARRLLALLDGEMQALGAWLTSPSIEVDLPDEAPFSPEGAGRGAAAPPAAAPLAPLRSGDSARSQGRDAPRGVSEAERTVQPAPSAPAGRLWEVEPMSPPQRRPTGRLYSGNTLSRPPLREEPAAFQPAAAAPLERPDGGAGPGDGLPPQPAVGAFAPVKNLQDLARWVREASVGEGEASPLSEPRVTATIAAEGEEAESGAARGRRLPAEVWRPTALPAREGAPPLLQPSQSSPPSPPSPSSPSSQSSPSPPSLLPPSQRSQERAPAPLPSAVSGASPAPPSAASPAGEPLRTPFPEETAEVDVESLLEALSRSVADEYKRFYGS